MWGGQGSVDHVHFINGPWRGRGPSSRGRRYWEQLCLPTPPRAADPGQALCHTLHRHHLLRASAVVEQRVRNSYAHDQIKKLRLREFRYQAAEDIGCEPRFAGQGVWASARGTEPPAVQTKGAGCGETLVCAAGLEAHRDTADPTLSCQGGREPSSRTPAIPTQPKTSEWPTDPRPPQAQRAAPRKPWRLHSGCMSMAGDHPRAQDDCAGTEPAGRHSCKGHGGSGALSLLGGTLGPALSSGCPRRQLDPAWT